MVSYLGVDWAGGCWAVVKTGNETLVTTEPSILNVWHEHGQDDDVRSILVDIPIGLPEDGVRACDEEASERLKSQGNTVFSIPRKAIVETEQYGDAREMNGGSLGSQSWWLFPRIREVDVFLQEYEDALTKMYESHPEICFRRFVHDIEYAKDTVAGREERLEVLRTDSDLHKEVEAVVDQRKDRVEWHERISKGRLDDVLDAAVLALTAKRIELGRRSESNEYPALPEEDDPGEDEKLGISPEILYPRAL